MDSASKWCTLGLEESMNCIIAAEKQVERNPSDSSRIFGDLRRNTVDIFRGVTEKVLQHSMDQVKKLKAISEAFQNRDNLGPQELSANVQHLKHENQELRVLLQREEEKNIGYQKDLKKLEEKVKYSAADAAHSKCEQCNQRPRDVLFLPCRHFVICEDCSQGLRKCPYCDGNIEESLVAEY